MSQILFLAVALFLLLPGAALATVVQDPMLTESSNHPGVYITVGAGTYDGPNDNDISVTPDHLILNETMMFNASGNMTLSLFNHSNNTLNFTAYGAGGKLNFTLNLTNAGSNFAFKSDGTYIQALLSNSTGWVGGNRTISGTYIFTFAPRNISYSSESASPNQVPVFNTVTLSLDIVDNDGGTISSGFAQIQKPGGITTNYTMTKGVGNAFALAFSDTGTAGTYSIVRYYVNDSDGLQYTSPVSSLTFSITASTAGGTTGATGGTGGSPPAMPDLLPNVTNVLENLIPAAQNPLLLPQAPSINLLTLMNDPAGLFFLELMLVAGIGLLTFWTGLPRVVAGIGKNKMSNNWFYLAGIMIIVPLYALGYASDVIDPKAVIGVIVVMFAAVFIMKS